MGDFAPRDLTLAGETRRVHVGGQGPAVTVMQEMPGLSPQVVRFARWLRDAGFTVWLPSLFGAEGTAEAGASIFRRACTAVAFRTLTGQGASPVTAWLRSLARLAQAECGGPGVGAVGMCFTGSFALSMMLEPAMLAPVLCQPALPLDDPAALESPPRELARVRHRLGRDQRSSRPPNSIACRRPAVRFPQKRPASARKLATSSAATAEGCHRNADPPASPCGAGRALPGTMSSWRGTFAKDLPGPARQRGGAAGYGAVEIGRANSHPARRRSGTSSVMARPSALHSRRSSPSTPATAALSRVEPKPATRSSAGVAGPFVSVQAMSSLSAWIVKSTARCPSGTDNAPYL
ncbi:hypothetical protein E3U26_14985 (plasmid) [Paracoccus ferrooxidans]|nr:hypothetical protein E3U26_14985 [Paracoccus ferrooxidans]